MFIDEIEIKVKGGNGGKGCSSFRREKFAPRGGPDGGNGGEGGNIVMIADENLNTLYHLTHIPRFIAEDGEAGKPKNCAGKDGQNLLIKVPPGTIIKDIKKGVTLKDLKKSGESVIVVLGGKGGRGNKSFATSINQAPRVTEKGGIGEERYLKLELKLIADVGIVGMPNAGKSTLLSKLSSARPKIAEYPFTTLYPYLGIIDGGRYRTCVMADLPGLIEGAHKGVGLGDRFLRHIERTRIILHLVDVSPYTLQSPQEAYKIIRNELALYSIALSKKPELVIANKIDLRGSEARIKKLSKVTDIKPIAISALTGQGLNKLVRAIFEKLDEVK